ncbi:YidC/Oxa1 family membrane protein insertase [Candidatus Saccharibacteria bacterium]|nr:YidC/Oxa1 family membrane protein insertase [Candidatus Saccharibacteria bacterium]
MFNTFIVQPIFNLLLVIYSLIPGGDFGIALIIFTIIVRLLMWPLLKKQLHQAKAMRKMQPELARIKREAKGNRQLEGVMMMELYKKHDIKPFSSILVLLIQLPIFIALYEVIRIFTSQREQIASFTYEIFKGIGPISNLIVNPNNFNQKMLGFFDLSAPAVGANAVNIFVLIVAVGAAVTQYIMSKQTTPQQSSKKSLKEILNEAADGKQADQGEINAVMMSKMTKFLPIMMFFIMINLPGALVLYYTVSNVVAIFQQRSILKEDTEEMIEIADSADKPAAGKKATLKAREKQAVEGKVIRIVAKDTTDYRSKKEKK